MNRRGFLLGILAAGVAPAIVRAESLMAVKPVGSNILRLAQFDAIKKALIGIDYGYLSSWSVVVARGYALEERFTAPYGHRVLIPAGSRILRVETTECSGDGTFEVGTL